MAEGKRPGGLTALAVLNFIWGAFAAIGALLFLTGAVLVHGVAKAAENAGGEVHETGVWVLWLELALLAISAFTLIAAGVGFLKQKKSGRTMANVYAVCAIAGTGLNLGLMHGGVGAGTIIGLVWPVLMLVFANKVYKDNLVG